MKKTISGIFSLALTALVLLSASVSAFATETPEVIIPVKVSLSGAVPETKEDYTVVMKADDASYPMPSGSQSDEYALTVTGDERTSFPSITYNHVGVYSYSINEEKGTNDKCTYDSSFYTLTVYITNAEDGGLESTAVLYPNDGTEKVDAAEFENSYEAEPTPTPTAEPTATPTPSAEPTEEPTPSPTTEPTVKPTTEPTTQPTVAPTSAPTATPVPSDTPKTGDTAKPMLYIVIFALSLLAVVALIFTKKKSTNNK